MTWLRSTWHGYFHRGRHSRHATHAAHLHDHGSNVRLHG